MQVVQLIFPGDSLYLVVKEEVHAVGAVSYTHLDVYKRQLEHRALARTGAAYQRDLPALLCRHGEVTQDGLFAIAEGHMRKLHIPARSGPQRQ